ncbi:MAG: hypothetical protein U0575_03190 [Phycisphaerales bacterium]
MRHPRFGLGRIEALMPRGPSSTARVAFNDAGVKTLVLEYAGLVRIS